jgi:hypothetical protein
MHRTAELRRADAPIAVPAPSLPSEPVRLEPILFIRCRGHWNGWELFVRLLIFATRNNHRRDLGEAAPHREA